jgi:hypothetical protein
MFKKPLAFAEICRNVAEVLLASVFISSIFETNIHFLIGFLSFLCSMMLWLISLYLEKE